MSLPALRFWPRRSLDAAQCSRSAKGLQTKYNRSAMEIRRQLQCNVLRDREKSRRRKNNGEQWKKQCAEQ